jgi:hypothetical protein
MGKMPIPQNKQFGMGKMPIPQNKQFGTGKMPIPQAKKNCGMGILPVLDIFGRGQMS